MKYVLVTGGGISGIGKGILASSIGALLKSCNLKVTAIKIDPYINIDAGTLSPFEHGEVYVLRDGCEVDLDLGNYERFLDVELKWTNNITTGKIYQQVIDKERKGDYDGQTVRIIPHITNAIRDWITKTAVGFDVCIIEQGGTVGDIEAMPFIEALRQLRRSVGPEDFCCVHINLVPYIKASKELKSKLVQESVRVMRTYGLLPDIIACRSEVDVNESIKTKISDFCDVNLDRIFSLADVETTYQVPMKLYEQGMIDVLTDCLKLKSTDKLGQKMDLDSSPSRHYLQQWHDISDIAVNAKETVIIALVGKYTTLGDSYFSIIKALEHACFHFKTKPEIRQIESTDLEDNNEDAWKKLKSSSCLLVPGGFGLRGSAGKIAAIKWARENRLPFLGICLGFQLAVVEFCRNIMSIKDAHSAEFAGDLGNITPVIIKMLEYVDSENRIGGTMRLGLRDTHFVTETSILRKLYNDKEVIQERHRHRYEVNPVYVTRMEQSGMRFVGKNDDRVRMEILELDELVHPYYVGVQYHPEYSSRPFRPSPPFVGLIKSAIAYSSKKCNDLFF